MSAEQRALDKLWALFPGNRQAEMLARYGAASLQDMIGRYTVGQLGVGLLLRQGSDNPQAAWAACVAAESAPAAPDEKPPAHDGSHSARELDMLLACPRRWAWHYIHKQPHPQPGPAAAVGAAIHRQIADALRGKAKAQHPAARNAVEHIAGMGVESVEQWQDNGILCGRLDAITTDPMVYGRRSVVDWKTCEDVEPARDDGLQPVIYTALAGADRVQIVQLAVDGSDVESTPGDTSPRQWARLGCALVLCEAWRAAPPSLGATPTCGEPGGCGQCVAYGIECPAGKPCGEAKGLEMDLASKARELWGAIPEQRRERILQTARFASFDAMLAALGADGAVPALQALADPAPLPPPAPKATTPTAAAQAEGPHPCKVCGSVVEGVAALCVMCSGKSPAEPKKRGRPKKAPGEPAEAPRTTEAPTPPPEAPTSTAALCRQCGGVVTSDREGWSEPACHACVLPPAPNVSWPVNAPDVVDYNPAQPVQPVQLQPVQLQPVQLQPVQLQPVQPAQPVDDRSTAEALARLDAAIAAAGQSDYDAALRGGEWECACSLAPLVGAYYAVDGAIGIMPVEWLRRLRVVLS